MTIADQHELAGRVLDAALSFAELDRHENIAFKCDPKDAFRATKVVRAFEKFQKLAKEYDERFS